MKLPVKPRAKEIDTRKFVFTIIGEPKCGKSTFASKFPNALFLATEAGTKFLEVNQLTDDNGEPIIIKTWKEFCEAVKLVCTTQHDFKTVVIDVVDNAYEMCARQILAENGWKSESEGEWGAGHSMVRREFKRIIDALLGSGLGVVFITHTKQMEREDRGVKRMFIDSSLPSGGRGYVNGASDFIFYCFRDSKGARLMRTKANENFQGGDRSGLLPEVMPLDYDLMIKYLTGELVREK
jgi:hypothetical protein